MAYINGKRVLSVVQVLGGGSDVEANPSDTASTELIKIKINGVTYSVVNSSDLSNFITASVNNLTNYYLKSETYTKAEVNSLVGNITTFEVVQTLPTQDIKTNVIYLVPKSTAQTNNVYDEYIYTNNAWEKIGDTTIDLSNYYTKTQVDAALSGKANTSDLSSVATSGSYNDLSNKPTKLSDFTDDLGSNPTHTHSQYLTSHQDISGKENTSNKVTSFQQTPDDTHYPSEKLVKDNLDAINIDIGTLEIDVDDLKQNKQGTIQAGNGISIRNGYIIDAYNVDYPVLSSSVQASLDKADTSIQNIKTINGQSLLGTGNVSITFTQEYQRDYYLVLLSGGTPVFSVFYARGIGTEIQTGSITKAEAIDIIEAKFQWDSSADKYYTTDVKEKIYHYDVGQDDIVFDYYDLLGVTYDENDTTQEIAILTGTNGSVSKTYIDISEIGNDDQSTYYFEIW